MIIMIHRRLFPYTNVAIQKIYIISSGVAGGNINSFEKDLHIFSGVAGENVNSSEKSNKPTFSP